MWHKAEPTLQQTAAVEERQREAANTLHAVLKWRKTIGKRFCAL